MPILTLGVSYRRASVDLLERLAVPAGEEPKAYRRLRDLGSVREGVLLSTCNRVEVTAEVDGYHTGFQELKGFLSDLGEMPTDEIAEPLYSHYEDDAAEHLFAVAAGLDSMVVGEPQILSQVRAAMRRADAEGAVGPELGFLFQRAVAAGRRVRAESGIGARAGVLIEAGLDLAAEHLGGLKGRSALVVGAGDMGSLAGRVLRHRGVGELVVLGRSPERAERLAGEVQGRAGDLSSLDAALTRADVVVSSTAAAGLVVSADRIAAAVADGRPMFILDLAVPRDVDPLARDVEGVRLADLDDLAPHVAGTAARRDLDAARQVLAHETRRFAEARRARRLAPLVQALHDRGERIREDELRRLGPRLAGLSERDREAVEALTRRIVRRLLHEPTVRLKERGSPDDAFARAVAELFDLGE